MATNNSINTGKPIEVVHGGTQKTSFTVYAPITGGTISTGALQSAATGISNVGYALTSTGAASLPTWQAQSGSSGGMILLATQTASNSASIAFTSLLSVSYANYVLVVSNYLPATDGTNLYIQFSSDNGANYGAAATYGCLGSALLSAQQWVQSFANPGAGYLVLDQVHNSGVPAAAYVILQNITTGAPTYANVQSSGQADSVLTSGFGFQLCSSQSSGSLAVWNAFRCIASSGNITQGTFSLYALAQ